MAGDAVETDRCWDRPFAVAQIGQRIAGPIKCGARQVAIVAGTQQRDHNVGIWHPSPTLEGAGKIGFRFGHVPFRGNIKQASRPDGGVGEEACRVIAGILPAPLQRLIDQSSGIGDVVSEMPDGIAHRLWHHNLIDPRHRIDHAEEKRGIEHADTAVERFGRIVEHIRHQRRARCRCRLALRRRGGRSATRQQA